MALSTGGHTGSGLVALAKRRFATARPAFALACAAAPKKTAVGGSVVILLLGPKLKRSFTK
jgi:hypothetical protein